MPPLKNYNFNETTESTHIKRILAFGDSLTEGFMSGGRKFYPYTTKLEEKLNSYFNWTRFEVLNEGISGECVFTEMVTRLPKVLGRVGNRVNLVIILGGTNDFHKLDCLKRVNVAHEVISLHKIVHKAGLKSVLVTIPECSSLGKKCDKARVKVNDKLRGWALAHKKNTLLCDLGQYMPLHNMSMFDRKVFWDDEIHPSKIGYDKIAALLFHTIREELEPPILNNTITNILFESKAIKMAPKPKPLRSTHHHKNTSRKNKHMKDSFSSAITPSSTFSPNNSIVPSNPASTSFTYSATAAINALPPASMSTSLPTAFNYTLPSTNATNVTKTHPFGTPSFNYALPFTNTTNVTNTHPFGTPPSNYALPFTNATNVTNTHPFGTPPSSYTLPFTNTTNVTNTHPFSTPPSNYTQTFYSNNDYPSYNGTYDARPNGTLPTYNTTDAGDLQKEFPDYYIDQHL